MLAACFVALHHFGWGSRSFAPGPGSGTTAVGRLLGSYHRFRFRSGSGSPSGPSAARIGDRLVALVAVAARGLSEYGVRDFDEAEDGIAGWVRAAGAGHEVEDFEASMLEAPAGALEDDELARGTWQIEGAVVLAWALGLLELPSYDEGADPRLLAAALGLPDAARTREVLRSAGPRHHALVDHEAERYYSIHWRLREFAATGHGLDLESFAKQSPSGPLRFEHVPLVDGDLALAGRPIGDAGTDAVDVALGITVERLHALNWLRRGGKYSTGLPPTLDT